MKWPTHIDDSALRELIVQEAGGPVIESPWPCDALRLHAALIEAHNQYGLSQGWPIEAKFANIDSTERTLGELLWEDFTYLTESQVLLKDKGHKYLFTGIAGPGPNAVCLTIDVGESPLHVIAFRSPLLYLIHSLFSKIIVLTHDDRYAEAIPEHRELFDGDEYSDTNLLAAFFNDVEVLYDQRHLFLPVQPPHRAAPYDYCEQVEGARRFSLAHELGHTLYPGPAHPSEIESLVMLATGYQIPIEHHEEYWCDAFAITTILNRYNDGKLTEVGLYELQNAVVGILQLFILYDVIDAALGRHLTNSLTYPAPRLRQELVRCAVKTHTAFVNSELLQGVLNKKWSRLNSFREFVGGANAPMAFQLNSLWSSSDFTSRLTDFGAKAYRRLFEATQADVAVFYRGNQGEKWADFEAF
jgi:hypothetical protein